MAGLALVLGLAPHGAVALAQPSPAGPAAQAPGNVPASRAPAPSTWSTSVRNVTRVEGWDFFTPRPGGGDPTTAHVGNRLTFGLQWRTGAWRVQGQGQYVQMLGLPSDAIGPGPLGTGALYFDHSGRSDARQLYLRTLTVTAAGLVPGLDVTAGRLAYQSGAEHPSGDAGIEQVKRQRLDARIVGDFDWSIFQRAFDGVRLDARAGGWRLTGLAVQPTQGGFEDAAGVGASGVRLLSAVVSPPFGRWLPRTDVQAFVHAYRDTRAVTQRPDNTGRTATRVDIRVPTVGASLVGRYPAGDRLVDVVGWTAWQGGDWYGLRHRAYAVATEGGVQWPKARWQPWLRVAWFRGSGDAQPGDGRHGTFFPVMPTARKYALNTLYTTANIDDLFGQILLRPSPRLGLKAELHRLRLAAAADRWYGGAGVTQQRGRLFGLVARPSGGASDLGTSVDLAGDVSITRHLSVNAYLSHVRGGSVVGASFAGDSLTYGYVETVITY